MPPVTLAAPDAVDVPETVARQAVQWLIELQTKPLDEGRMQAWMRWRHASAVHERAWLRIEEIDDRLRQVGSAAVAIEAVGGAERSRRRTLKLLAAGVAGLGGTIVLLPRAAPFQAWMANHATPVGERRTVRLEDGTRVALNTDSALNVRYGAQRRVLELLRGEILVETGGDPAGRPFLVRTAQGDARALGTRFTVRQYDASTRVSVWEGLVALEPRRGAGPGLRLRAGEQGAYTSTSAQGPEASDPYADSWARGYLTADHTPLAVFLAEVARYRQGWVQCDPAVAHLPVSGTFPLDDPDRILASLPHALPVEVRRRTRYWVRVEARSPAA
ncbi:fec operon regulator FecR [Pigmentiphaga humi]|uniref:Fec operon regulator FecR n=1 Tax=Pigmentiphaga humi TaxID=2478468 RepID=A0A3P4AZZ5_9BURK|nr:FecR family protein [Pigmentiphaga humi]VCU69151.1 fec operon regulator FecR [Pigmentiphaga humi]